MEKGIVDTIYVATKMVLISESKILTTCLFSILRGTYNLRTFKNFDFGTIMSGGQNSKILQKHKINVDPT